MPILLKPLMNIVNKYKQMSFLTVNFGYMTDWTDWKTNMMDSQGTSSIFSFASLHAKY